MSSTNQTVGNCSQYIQLRDFEWRRRPGDQQPRAIQALSALDADACGVVAGADTFFVATNASPANGDATRGADVSHRGGRAGFVKIEDECTLLVPEFPGNSFFMTLGNIQLEPRTGLLFVDFGTGDVLTLSGKAEIVWEGDELKDFAGAEFAWRFRMESGWRLRDALPLRWQFKEWSPHSLITGTWEDAARRLQAEQLAQTWRPYRVTRAVDESLVIRSFYLEPADGRATPLFEAGQHLPIRLNLLDGTHGLQRVYTISSAPSDVGLRLSVKREGAASIHLHDHVAVGGIIEALGPRGTFTIDTQARRPAVLIGAGVGITPMMAFLRQIVAEGFRYCRTRPVHLIQVARNESVRAFAAELQQLVDSAQGAVHLHVMLDHGGPGALVGPLTTERLKEILPFDDYEFFLCGPGGLMQTLYEGLRDLRVRDSSIHSESFGPASLRRSADVAEPGYPTPILAAKCATVVFSRAGASAVWTPQCGTLLEFAEGEGLTPPYSCRIGECGSCATQLKAGRVTYEKSTAWRPAAGEVLLCCARPASDGGGELDLDL